MPGAQRMAELLAEVETAVRAGLDAFGIREHHGEEFLDSSPAVVLTPAVRTKTIRLGKGFCSQPVPPSTGRVAASDGSNNPEFTDPADRTNAQSL